MIETKNFAHLSQEKLYQDFQDQGYPTRKTERWKFTPISLWYEKEIVSGKDKDFFIEGDNYHQEEISGDAVQTYQELIKSNGLWEEDDALFKLHLSQVKKVYQVTYKGSDVLKIHHTSSKFFMNYAIILKVENDCSIVEKFESSSGFHQSSRALIIENNITVKHILQQENSPSQANQIWLKVAQNSNSNYQNFFFNLGGGLTRYNPYIKIQNECAHADCHAHYFLSGQDHSDIFSKIVHLAPNTTSDQVVKGLLHQNSKSSFTGNIFIDKNCPGVAAEQFNKNLIMDKGAQAFGQPQLEIFSDDVKCAHGSTTGQVDDEELFYLVSRGISPRKAKRLITESYGKEILAKIQNDKIEKELELALSNKLGGFYAN